MQAEIAYLPGDGIGPEVLSVARKVLTVVGEHYGHSFHFTELLLGGAAIDAVGTPLPEGTLAHCLAADAILLGAVGGPRWDNPTAAVRPEAGLLALRKRLGLFANLRPVRPHPALVEASPLRGERLAGVDVLIVRELTGGIYFGEPRLRREVAGELQAVDTMAYTQSEVRRVAHTAFRLAEARRRMVASVDKANVLECSRLWRQTVEEVSMDYPEVTLEHVLVDAAAMYLVTRPARYDVILTENMFGDILSDEASVLSGSMGLLPSASLGEATNSVGMRRGLYEPVHGSAPDIAGRGIANPIGAILSAALALRHSLGLDREARRVEESVHAALSAGHRTVDVASGDETPLSTDQFGDIIIKQLTEN